MAGKQSGLLTRLRAGGCTESASLAIAWSCAGCRRPCSGISDQKMAQRNFKAHMRAREMQAEYFVDELAAIADDGRNDFERSRSSRSTATNSSPFSEVGVSLLYPSPAKLNRKIAHKNAPLLDNGFWITNQIYVFCLTRTKAHNHARVQDAHRARH